MKTGQSDNAQPSRLERLRRPILLLATIGFFVGIYLSFRAQPDLLSDLAWPPLIALALLGVPVTVALNTQEFRLSAQLIGRDFTFAQALEITIIGGVANLLPIPGSTMVRVAALKSAGATVKQGTMVTLLVSTLWIGIAFLYAGLWLLMLEAIAPRLGTAFTIIGLGVLVACGAVCLCLSRSYRLVWQLVLTKLGLVVLDATRMWLSFLALGVAASFAQASVLTVASVTGAAVSIVPAGLGVREVVSALLGPVVLLTAAGSYLSSSLNRLVGLCVTAPVAIFLGLRRKPPT